MDYGGGNGRNVTALSGVTLGIEQGEFACLLGPSGCGKTTLLRIVAGLLRPTGGGVWIDGEMVVGPSPQRIVIFQQDATLPWLTVAENIRFGLCGQRRRDWKAIVEHYVRLTSLEGFENAYPRELSGGMKQRVEIARALAASPDVLLMDEPFGALDCLTRVKLRSELLDIWLADRKTILFVTHDVDEALQLADRVVVFGPRPARVQSVVPVPVLRPRDLDGDEYRRLRQTILQILNGQSRGFQSHQRPDRTPAARPHHSSQLITPR